MSISNTSKPIKIDKEQLTLQDIDGITSAKLLSYNINHYPFAAIAAAVFKVNSLKYLHKDMSRYKLRQGKSPILAYSDNLVLRRMLQKLDDNSLFYKVYHHFVQQIICSVFGSKISYSSHPKMRVHLAGTPSVSKWHRDADITRRPEQINVWLPFTNVYQGNSLWVESDYGLADYKPVSLNYGQALIFDGGFLNHGTVDNDTEVSRVSIDFRFSILGHNLPEAALSIFAHRPNDLQHFQHQRVT